MTDLLRYEKQTFPENLHICTAHVFFAEKKYFTEKKYLTEIRKNYMKQLISSRENDIFKNSLDIRYSLRDIELKKKH